MTITYAPPTFRFHDPETPLAYERLLRAAPRTLRCPVWLSAGAVERIDAWVPAAVPPLDALAVLEEWWPGPCPTDCGCLAPFRGFPGLAPGTGPDREELVREAAAWAENDAWRVRLVVGDGRSPGELVAALGWSGAAGERDLAGLATVLRSWEVRFGAVVTELAADRLTLTVATPPWTMPEAERVAAEHVAVCPDLAARSLRGYAARLCGARVWRLRWA